MANRRLTENMFGWDSPLAEANGRRQAGPAVAWRGYPCLESRLHRLPRHVRPVR